MESAKIEKLYKLDGVPFIVDIDKRELREKENQMNVISFNRMAYKGSHYQLLYDRKQRGTTTARTAVSDMMRIDVPQLIELDAVGMALKYRQPLNRIQLLSDYKVIVDQKILQQRDGGQLPEIEIVHKPFLVDLSDTRLFPRDNPRARGIQLDELVFSPDRQNYRAVYDVRNQSNDFLRVSDLLSIPKGLMLVEFPTESYLDPIGILKSAHPIGFKEFLKNPDSNFTMQSFLMEHQATQKLEAAKIIPWEKVGVKDLISQNLEKYTTREAQKFLDQHTQRVAPKKTSKGKSI